MMKPLGLKGLIAAPHTPMHEDGSLNLANVALQARWLEKSGVVGAFIGGTTGEWASVTVDERKEIFDAWAGESESIAVFAHVGHNCQADAIDMARHAAGLTGIHAISALSPSFFKPVDASAMAQYFAPIAAAAPNLPFYIYQIPGMTGVTVPIHQQIQANIDLIPTFAGVKFTEPDLFAFGRCKGLFGDKVELMWGVDEILITGLAFGTKSAVGSTYNYAAPLYNAVIAAYDAGDHDRARVLSKLGIEMVDLLVEYGVMRAGKALMGLRGAECGPTRLPIVPLTADEREELFSRARALGFLQDQFLTANCESV